MGGAGHLTAALWLSLSLWQVKRYDASHHKPTSLVYQALTSRLHDNQLVRTYQLVNLLVNLAGKMQPDLPAQYYIYVFVTAFL